MPQARACVRWPRSGAASGRKRPWLDAWRGSRPSLRRAELVRLGKRTRSKAGSPRQLGIMKPRRVRAMTPAVMRAMSATRAITIPPMLRTVRPAQREPTQSTKIGNPVQRLMLKTIVTEPRAIRASRIRKRLPGAARTLLAAPVRAGGAAGRAGAADLGVAVSDTAFAGCAGPVRVLEELRRCSRDDLRDRGVVAQARPIFESIEHPPPPPGLPAPELVDKVVAAPTASVPRARKQGRRECNPVGLDALR